MAAAGPQTRFQSCTERPFQVRDRLGWQAEAHPPPPTPAPKAKPRPIPKPFPANDPDQHEPRGSQEGGGAGLIGPFSQALMVGGLLVAVCLSGPFTQALIVCHLISEIRGEEGGKGRAKGEGEEGRGLAKGRRLYFEMPLQRLMFVRYHSQNAS